MRSISRMVLAGAALIVGCVAGCGGAVGENPYVVCNAVGVTDQEVDVALRELRLTRDDGYSATQVLDVASAACSTNPYLNYFDCLDCATAEVDSVY